ncbi:alpha/beta hydrolase [Mycolicibacterium goodii]|uniref:AB hydrolase-1 domain-containing protein n=1 Tax=Mycolicibacterium goodii TaxID=134601 RepID=A0A0K0X0Y7_MYCGD|nr:hypothetical protein AFA91_02560 [Mycolicibacterium goodii]
MSFTFALVHGHWHGNSAWSELEPILAARGHRVVSPHLPSDRLGHGALSNARTVLADLDAVAADPARTVLVGHSAGGLTIPLVARQRKVRHLVFIAALLPVPGRSVTEEFEADPTAEVAGFTWSTRPDGLLEMREQVARRHFYHDCPPEAADRAIARLRLQTPTTLEEASPLDEWPSVTADYVVCRRDRVLNPDWQRRTAVDRLAVEPVEIDSGHSPMLACPEILADLLDRLTEHMPALSPR